jgi:hypothetical protein
MDPIDQHHCRRRPVSVLLMFVASLLVGAQTKAQGGVVGIPGIQHSLNNTATFCDPTAPRAKPQGGWGGVPAQRRPSVVKAELVVASFSP